MCMFQFFLILLFQKISYLLDKKHHNRQYITSIYKAMHHNLYYQEEWSVAETFGKLQVKVEKGWLKKPHLNKYHFSTMYKDLRYLHQEFEQVSIWICKCRVVIWQPRLCSSLCWQLLTLGHESSVNGASTILLPQQRNGKSVLLHTAAAMEG